MAYNSYLLPNFGGGSPYSNPPLRGPGGGSPTTSPPMMLMGTGTGNVSARSVGTGFGQVGPAGGPYPAPQGYTYDLTRGGYITDWDANNANSAYNKYPKFNPGGDPNANRTVASYYSALGNLPTRTYGSLALERLYQSGGAQPNYGPSLNSMFGRPYQGPFAIPGQTQWWNPTSY